MKKILLTGTTSSGKTTLLKSIASSTQNLKFSSKQKVIVIHEYARELLTLHPELKNDPQLQDMLFAEHLQREIKAAEQKPDLIICDRGALDICAHARWFGLDIKPEWLSWAQDAYDYVFHLDKTDIAFEVTELQKKLDPGADWVSSREELEQHITWAVQESGLPWRKLSGTVAERREVVQELYVWPLTGPEGQFYSGKERR